MTNDWLLAGITFSDKPHQVRSDSPKDGTGVCKICFREQRLNPPHPVNGWRVPNYYLTNGVCEECRLEQQTIYESSLCMEGVLKPADSPNWNTDLAEYNPTYKLFCELIKGEKQQHRPLIRTDLDSKYRSEFGYLKWKLKRIEKLFIDHYRSSGWSWFDIAKSLAEANILLKPHEVISRGIDDTTKDYSYQEVRDDLKIYSWHPQYKRPLAGCQKTICQAFRIETPDKEDTDVVKEVTNYVKKYFWSHHEGDLEKLEDIAAAGVYGLVKSISTFYPQWIDDGGGKANFTDSDAELFRAHVLKSIWGAVMKHIERDDKLTFSKSSDEVEVELHGLMKNF